MGWTAMIIVNLVLSLLVLCAVYGLTWFVVTALESADASAQEWNDEERLAA